MAKMSVPILVDWESIKDYMAKSDIVEVIRCKDCKHYFEDAFREDEWVICRRTNLYTDGDKYCAWAESKEE